MADLCDGGPLRWRAAPVRVRVSDRVRVRVIEWDSVNFMCDDVSRGMFLLGIHSVIYFMHPRFTGN